MNIKVAQLIQMIPDYVFNAADILLDNGYKAFLVGGAVRDLLIGRDPKDFDIATDAMPEEIEKIFPRAITTNASFGTVIVVIDGFEGERYDLEITTFRKEENYFGGRWPGKVEFTSDLVADLSRRDFTIDAIAIDLDKVNTPGQIQEEIIIDPFSGIEDLDRGIIRAVGNPLERFKEDGLRAFRACRLASELGFVIEEDTFQSIKQTLNVSGMVSMERIRDEFVKLLKYSPKPSVGIELMRESGLLALFIPELLETIGIEQPEYHVEDVYHHILRTCDLAEDCVKIPALLHDIGKARTLTKDEKGIHFYKHDLVSTELAEVILKRLKFSKNEIRRVVSLIRWHMFYYPSADWRKNKSLDELQDESRQIGGWSDTAIRRFIRNVGEELIEDLFKLRLADATSNPKTKFNPIELKALQERIANIKKQDMALKVEDLDISGHDIIALGIPAGPEIGRILDGLLDIVIEDPAKNEKTILMDEAKKLENTRG